MFNTFQPQEAARIKSHFAALCQLALVDATVTRSELQFLEKLRREYGLRQEELDFAMDQAFSTPFVAPTQPMERLAQVYDMVRMVLLDNPIDERKVALCVDVAQKMNFQPHIVGDIVKALVTLPDDEGKMESTLETDDLRAILKENREG